MKHFSYPMVSKYDDAAETRSNLTAAPLWQIFNLSERRPDLSELNRRVSEYGWPETLAPPLDRLCSICKAIDNWTSDSPNNVAVLHSCGTDTGSDR